MLVPAVLHCEVPEVGVAGSYERPDVWPKKHAAPVKGGGKQGKAVHGEGLILIGICDGKGTQCEQAGNMPGALVKANPQHDEVQVTMKVLVLPGKE